jgi:YD repeat-containing protein
VDGLYTVDGGTDIENSFVTWRVTNPGVDGQGRRRLFLTEIRGEDETVTSWTQDDDPDFWELNETTAWIERRTIIHGQTVITRQPSDLDSSQQYGSIGARIPETYVAGKRPRLDGPATVNYDNMATTMRACARRCSAFRRRVGQYGETLKTGDLVTWKYIVRPFGTRHFKTTIPSATGRAFGATGNTGIKSGEIDQVLVGQTLVESDGVYVGSSVSREDDCEQRYRERFGTRAHCRGAAIIWAAGSMTLDPVCAVIPRLGDGSGEFEGGGTAEETMIERWGFPHRGALEAGHDLRATCRCGGRTHLCVRSTFSRLNREHVTIPEISLNQPDGRVTYETDYDSGRQVWEIDENGTKTEYSNFDFAGRPRTITVKGFAGSGSNAPEQADRVTTVDYDAAGQKLSEVLSSGGTSLTKSWTYDTAGRLLTETSNGITTTYPGATSNRRRRRRRTRPGDWSG